MKKIFALLMVMLVSSFVFATEEEVVVSPEDNAYIAQSAPVKSLDRKLGDTRSELKRVAAQSAAISQASAIALAPVEVGDIGVGVGQGVYNSKTATAVAIGFKATEDLSFSGSWANGDSSMYGVGVGYKFNFK